MNKNNKDISVETILKNYEERIELLELKNDLILKYLKKVCGKEYFSIPNQLKKIIDTDDLDLLDFIMYE